MIFDILLAVIFVGGTFALWYRISQRIPQLVAIPDHVITQHLHEDSARLRLFVLHFTTFYREKYYQDIFWKFVAKALYRLHIVLLRLDNFFVALLQRVRAYAGVVQNGKSGFEERVISTERRDLAHHSIRIQEVRQKKSL